MRSNMAAAMSEGDCLVTEQEARSYVERCLMAEGTNYDHANLHAKLLVAADKRGHFSHGINRTDMYVHDLKHKLCDGNATPTVVHETVSTALVDGNNGLGSVVGKYCMELAIHKAKQTGFAFVSARHSNHFGIAGFYVEMAMKEGLIGWAFTNGSPLVAPTRSKNAAFCTNPIAVGSQAMDGDKFLLDMATSAVALGKCEIQARKGEPIPVGWGLDGQGKPTTDPQEVINNGVLMPLGGPEDNSGYKGYGLGFLVEVLSAVLSGSSYGLKVKRWMSRSNVVCNYGHAFMALDPSLFNPNYNGDLKEFMDTLRSMEPRDPSQPVLIPGDKEFHRISAVDERRGILYPKNIVTKCNQLANEIGVKAIVHG